MHACVLASGSRGNALWLESGAEALLVDCGLTVPELSRRLAHIGREVTRLSGIVVTHDHGDHVGSSVVLARRLGIPLHATEGTHSVLRRLPEPLAPRLVAGQVVDVGPFRVHPFATPHDGIESIGVRVEADGVAVGLATDLGYVSRQVVEALRGVQLLVVEHNHDERLLQDGPYPLSLKRRIRGGRGHLTNDEGAQLASLVAHEGLKRVVLAHLSETNNTPDHARRAYERLNRDAPALRALHVAEQHRPSEPFEV
jgi:phosphoribosyl 1,2-cyclic phosphodiesterase